MQPRWDVTGACLIGGPVIKLVHSSGNQHIAVVSHPSVVVRGLSSPASLPYVTCVPY